MILSSYLRRTCAVHGSNKLKAQNSQNFNLQLSCNLKFSLTVASIFLCLCLPVEISAQINICVDVRNKPNCNSKLAN